MKAIFKTKQFVVTSIIIFVIISGLIGYKFYNESQYLKRVQEIKTNIIIVSSLSEEITNEYSEIWGKKIKAGYGDVWVDGEYKHFSNFEDAVKFKMDEMSDAGILEVMDSLSNSIHETMHDISPAPSKYKDLHITLTKLYTDGNEYISLAKSPVGSLMSFNEKRSELSALIKREIDEIDISQPLQANISQKILEIKTEISKKKFKKEVDELKLESEIQKKRLSQFVGYRKECENYLALNMKKTGVITTQSGLQYIVVKRGSGAIPTDLSMVKVDYHGTLIDGTVFDSSVDRKEPMTFQVNKANKGLSEALKLMPVGSKYKLYIPQQLAYAGAEMGIIKPFSMLIFEVKLISIEK